MRVATKSPAPRQKPHVPRLAPSGSFVSTQAGFSVWCFEKGSWRMVENRSGKGHVPGSAPKGRGKFDGDCVKVTSVPARRKGK